MGGPSDVVVEGSLVYIADLRGGAILQLDVATKRLTTLATSRPLVGPFRLAVAADHTLLVVQTASVLRVVLANGLVTELTDWRALTESGRTGVVGSVTSDGHGGAYISGNHDIARIDGVTGEITHVAGKVWLEDGPDPGATNGDGGPASAARFADINDVLTDADGHLYVSQAGDVVGDDRIRPLDARGGLVFCEARGILRLDLSTGQVTVVSNWVPRQGGAAGLAVAADGALIVGDFVANRVRRIDPVSGRVTTLAGRGRPRRDVQL